MRSKASASPCCARRMASASPSSRTTLDLVRATGPVGTHQLLSMPSLLHKVVYHYLLLSVMVGRSGVLREFRPTAGFSWAGVFEHSCSSLPDTCAARRAVKADLPASETTLCRNPGNSSSGNAQKNDFSTMAVSHRAVLRS